MEIIRKLDNKVEFYTVDLTGQSGMSQTGLAELAGVTRQALIQLETTLVSKAPSESLEPFVGEVLTLVISDPTIDGKAVGNLKIYKASYCAAVLKHYASPPRGNQIALYSLLKFAERGISDWIQEVTGWKQRSETLKPYTDVYIQRIENVQSIFKYCACSGSSDNFLTNSAAFIGTSLITPRCVQGIREATSRIATASISISTV